MASLSIAAPTSVALRPLPIVNLLEVQDQRYVDALLEEALPADRVPFREYLTKRILGIGIVIAAPGFGKTTLLSVAGLAMQASLGQILCSGPSNVAVDNLARRVDRTTRLICARYNEEKWPEDPSRARHRLVVRGYNKKWEMQALVSLLEDPDFIPPVSRGKHKNPWQLPLSVAYWTLALLGSRSSRIPALDRDDSEVLHGLYARIRQREDMRNVCAVASGQMSWQEFAMAEDIGALLKNQLASLMSRIVEVADLLCTTPAQAASHGSDYADWVERTARGVLIDEAANMHRADVGCVWGNDGLPCFFGGDPCQLPPTVMTGQEKDLDGNFYNRVANNGGISPLTFLQASGLPVYRLRMQLRMAVGLFDWVAKELYSEVNFTYADHCAVNRHEFAAGHLCEKLIRSKFPTTSPSPPGKFLPFFVHCQGAQVYVDQRTGSKQCPKQVDVALDFALGLVKEGVKPGKITVLSPYAANVELIAKRRRLPKYAALTGMDPASTVDAFQGQENDIIIAIIGTSFPTPGPGCTTDPHRLNVLLTRQRCGLVVVGDIDIRGPGGNAGKNKGRGDGKGGKAEQKSFLVISPSGERKWVKALMLQHIYASMISSGRVGRVKV
ncbi:P-loop containing nucleoside triphosphate hydrolase protein [Chaetomium sp. MPI-CAGE-AT-0009]|nr:P-loop containing nucleoside triphosphate hydrolase protein [Chaetomium sp. MPI-CAGE-AT-0009]